MPIVDVLAHGVEQGEGGVDTEQQSSFHAQQHQLLVGPVPQMQFVPVYGAPTAFCCVVLIDTVLCGTVIERQVFPITCAVVYCAVLNW